MAGQVDPNSTDQDDIRFLLRGLDSEAARRLARYLDDQDTITISAANFLEILNAAIAFE